MTDNEIIKALECCAERISCDQHCPYWRNSKGCDYVKIKVILDLINRQKAEIERLEAKYERLLKAKEQLEADGSQTIQRLCAEIRTLEKDNKYCSEEGNRLLMYIPKARVEAVKEFAERVKTHSRKMQSSDFSGEFWDKAVLVEEIDNLVKEMVGESK